MMEISGTPYTHGPHNIQGPHRSAAIKGSPNATNNSASAFQDEVQFSDEALRLSGAGKNELSSSGIRFDLVNRIKAEIAAGTYETPDKMDIAFSRMLGRLNPK
jgi:negative regulator of flagellin synthesis FlgM